MVRRFTSGLEIAYEPIRNNHCTTIENGQGRGQSNTDSKISNINKARCEMEEGRCVNSERNVKDKENQLNK